MLETCWSPFIWTNGIKTGSKAIAGYTVAASLILITLIFYQLFGGESTQLYNPFFETDIRNCKLIGYTVDCGQIILVIVYSNFYTRPAVNALRAMIFYGVLCIVYFIGLILSSFSMIFGMNIGVRGWLIPWLGLWAIGCLFQLLFGLWLLYGYYIYLSSVFYALNNWIWMSYNIYCWFVVYSVYKLIEKFQSPNIELLWP